MTQNWNIRLSWDTSLQGNWQDGQRVVLSSPGCIGTPWQFVNDLNGTLDGLNTNLMYIRDETADITKVERLAFVDHFWNLYQARFTSASEYRAISSKFDWGLFF